MSMKAAVFCILFMCSICPATSDQYSLWKKVEFLRYNAHNPRVARYFLDMQMSNIPTSVGEPLNKITPLTPIPQDPPKVIVDKPILKPTVGAAPAISQGSVATPGPSLSDELHQKLASDLKKKTKSKKHKNRAKGRGPKTDTIPTTTRETPSTATPRPQDSSLPSASPRVHMVKIHGNDYLQYYYLNLMVGSPPSQQSVILDTGSDITAFPCNCKEDKCGTHENPMYSASLNSLKCGEKFGRYSCQKCDERSGLCRFDISYAEGSSISGALFKEQVMFGNAGDNMDPGENERHNLTAPVNMLLGCTTREKGQFRTQKANGIAGLYSLTNSSRISPNLIDSALKAGAISRNVFSLCYGQWGGYFTLGGSREDRHLKTAKKYTLKLTNPYKVRIQRIQIGDTVVYQETKWKRPYRAMLDSGTTFTFLREDVHAKILKTLNRYCSKQIDRCGGMAQYSQEACVRHNKRTYPTMEEFYASFPTISLVFYPSAKYEWRPRHYLKLFPDAGSETKVKYCNSINAKDGGPDLLGHMFMRGHDLTIDRDSLTATVVESDCEADSPSPPPPSFGRRLSKQAAPSGQPPSSEIDFSLMTDRGFVRGERQGKALVDS